MTTPLPSKRSPRVVSHCTGDVTCMAKMDLMTSGSLWDLASTFEYTGILGAKTSVLASTSDKVSTALFIYSV